jgi:hypothetical protein
LLKEKLNIDENSVQNVGGVGEVKLVSFRDLDLR